MKIFKNIFLLTACLFLTSLNLSCKKNKTDNSNLQNQTYKTEVKLKHLNAETKSYLEDKTIAVVLGHSYNDEETVKNLSLQLDINFGLSTEQKTGLVKVLVYPDDFIVAGKARISSLYYQLEDKNLAGLITLGAPEGLCNIIARLEDNSISKQTALWHERQKELESESDNSNQTQEKEEIPEFTRTYPVFSFFQQDDILGSESTADFVLDYIPQGNSLEEEQSALIPDFDVGSLLINSVQSMINLRKPVPVDKNLLSFVQKLTGKQKKVSHYCDYETGLQSVNHFVFE